MFYGILSERRRCMACFIVSIDVFQLATAISSDYTEVGIGLFFVLPRVRLDVTHMNLLIE